MVEHAVYSLPVFPRQSSVRIVIQMDSDFIPDIYDDTSAAIRDDNHNPIILYLDTYGCLDTLANIKAFIQEQALLPAERR